MFARFSCNDVPPELWEGWTIDERKELDKEYLKKNGQLGEFEPDPDPNDWVLMELMACKLTEEAQKKLTL